MNHKGAVIEDGTRRLFSRQGAATYLACSLREIDRLIAHGDVNIVRLPAKRHNAAAEGRRVLIDRRELDRVIDQHLQRRGQ